MRSISASMGEQALQAIGLLAFNLASKAAFALAQQKGRFDLGESSLAATVIDLLKSHLAVLLHVSAPAYGIVLHRNSTNRTDYLLETGQIIYS